VRLETKVIHYVLRLGVLIGTLVSGVLLVLAPNRASTFTGLAPKLPRGTTEIRAAMGGVFTVLGLAPLIQPATAKFRLVGMVYLAIALVRAPYMFTDKSAGERSNWISLGFEAIAAWILLTNCDRQTDKDG